jgi:outer membrane lipoprotein SlyB
MRSRLAALALLSVALLPGCVATSTTTRTWGDPYAQQQEEWVRYGRVEQVRETVQRQQGDPAAGAVAGALIGGLLGAAIGGHTHYDRWGYAHRGSSAGGAVAGAVGGAVVGAAASSGAAEDRFYEVFVRFEDGGSETFTFRGYLPFQPGEAVTLTPRGLVRG